MKNISEILGSLDGDLQGHGPIAMKDMVEKKR